MPGATPEAIVQKLSEEFMEVDSTPGFKEYCQTQSLLVDLTDARTFRREVSREIERSDSVAQFNKKS